MRDDHNHFVSSINKLKEDIAKLEESTKAQRQKFQQEKEKERKSLEMARAAEMAEMNRKIEELNSQYIEQQPYQKLEKQYNQKIEELKTNYVQSQYKHHDAMNVEEKKQLKINDEVKMKNENETKATLKNALGEAEKNVIEEQKQAFARNQILKEKIASFQKELDKIKKEREVVSKKSKQLKLNASITADGLEEYKAVGALQIAKIKSYREKVDAMKNSVAEQIAKKNNQIIKLKESGESRLDQLRKEIVKAKVEKDEKARELGDLKALAEIILNQRSQVESFFLTSMEEVSKEVTKNGEVKQPKVYGQKVDVSELDLADKEKILRTLFTRMSSGSKKEI